MDERKLQLLKERKNLEKNKPIADHRTMIQLNNLINPITDKEVRSFLRLRSSK